MKKPPLCCWGLVSRRYNENDPKEKLLIEEAEWVAGRATIAMVVEMPFAMRNLHCVMIGCIFGFFYDKVSI